MFTTLPAQFRSTRCVDGRLMRHDPQPDDPYLETDRGACPECGGKGCDTQEDSEYFARLARYARGCPGIGYEDVCEDPAECAAAGGCREIRERRALRKEP